MKDKIVIVGGGGHAKVIIGVLKRIAHYNILGYSDIVDKGPLLGIHYIGKDEDLVSVIDIHQNCKAALGLGNVQITSHRKTVYNCIKKMGFIFPVIISPSAVINEDSHIREGSTILDGVIINPSCIIGRGAIINSNATIEHDCTIGEFTHIASGVTISGGVSIGDHCLIGSGSSIIQDLHITDNVLVGAGAVVVKDIEEPGVYVGVPARRIK